MVAVYVIGSIMIALAIVLSIVILMQTGKDKSLSSTLAGGASETFFGRSGGSSKDKILFRITVVGSILFVILTVVLTILVSK